MTFRLAIPALLVALVAAIPFAAPQLQLLMNLALAKGKQNHDKRDSVKEQDWKREQGRIMRDRG
jgi:tmRNA-binding protein